MPTPQIKITYATLSADNPELHAAYDAALAKVKSELGRTYAPAHRRRRTARH